MTYTPTVPADTNWLPTAFEDDGARTVLRVWWDTTTADGRELARQLHTGERRSSNDSITLTIGRNFALMVVFQARLARDTLRGNVRWYNVDGNPGPVYSFVAAPADCRILAHAS